MTEEKALEGPQEVEVPEVPWTPEESGDASTPAERPYWIPKNLSARHLVMCEYHLAGYTNREIAAHLEMSEVRVGQVLRSPPARDFLASRVDDLNMQFHGQFSKVVNNFREALDHESIDVRMKAMDMWLKAHGRYQPKRDNNAITTVEDVIKRLFDQPQVQVNVDNRSVHINANDVRDNFDFLEDKS